MKRSVLALGMFDGVHVGHQVLLRRARALAKQRGVPLVACTFSFHPVRFIRPEKAPLMLTTLEERAHYMKEMGVDELYVQAFDQKMMEMRPEQYIAELCERFHPLFIVAGYNYSFGKNGEGNPMLLRALGEVFGFSAEVLPQITLDGGEVSSTVIRQMLMNGQVRRAHEMLGVPYVRQAIVEKSTGRGYWVQFVQDEKQAVQEGWYRGIVIRGDKTYPAVIRMQEGNAMIYLFATLGVGDEWSIRFLTELMRLQ